MRKIKVFLASSAELDLDKEQVEIFISRKNKDWHHKRLFIELLTWRDFISSMTDGRMQDKYNQYIRSCDIAIFLFHTKFGRYTKEEFDHAHDAFLHCRKKVKKPRIYTFFKVDHNETSEITEFRKYIDSLNHFYDTYHSMDDLFVKINGQLDKLENEGVVIKPDIIDKAKILKYAFYYFILPLLVLTGSFFSFYYFQPTDFTVKVSEAHSLPNLPFKRGNITLTYGNKIETFPISNEVTFKQIPSKYKHGKLKLHFEAQEFQSIDTLVELKNIVELSIRRDNSLGLIFGWVRDENNIPLRGVNISVMNLKTLSDEFGKFRIEIPAEQQSDSLRLTAFKEGYQLWDFTGTPSQTVEWKIILQK